METTDQDRKDAAFLTEGALKLIGQILVKHQAAVLSEFRVLHADLQSRDATIERLRAELADKEAAHESCKKTADHLRGLLRDREAALAKRQGG